MIEQNKDLVMDYHLLRKTRVPTQITYLTELKDDLTQAESEAFASFSTKTMQDYAIERMNQYQRIVEGYFDAAIFADLPEELDSGNFDRLDFNDEQYLGARIDVDEFMMELDKAAFKLGFDSGLAMMSDAYNQSNENKLLNDIGADFWLTRNGHGTGFWDRGKDEAFSIATEISKNMGNVDLEVGDDGKLAIMQYYLPGELVSSGKVKGILIENDKDIVVQELSGRKRWMPDAQKMSYIGEVGDKVSLEVNWNGNQREVKSVSLDIGR